VRKGINRKWKRRVARFPARESGALTLKNVLLLVRGKLGEETAERNQVGIGISGADKLHSLMRTELVELPRGGVDVHRRL
jgi:hypothetical protein